MDEFNEYGYREDYRACLVELLAEARQHEQDLESIPALTRSTLQPPAPLSDEHIRQLAEVEASFESDWS